MRVLDPQGASGPADSAGEITALRAQLDALGKAWDTFSDAVVDQEGKYEDGTQRFFFVDTPAAWQAFHRVDDLVADWQLRGAPASAERSGAAPQSAATAEYSREVSDRLASTRKRLRHASDDRGMTAWAASYARDVKWLLAHFPPPTGSSAVAAPEGPATAAGAGEATLSAETVLRDAADQLATDWNEERLKVAELRAQLNACCLERDGYRIRLQQMLASPCCAHDHSADAAPPAAGSREATPHER